jgi:hypothetical protein
VPRGASIAERANSIIADRALVALIKVKGKRPAVEIIATGFEKRKT